MLLVSFLLILLFEIKVFSLLISNPPDFNQEQRVLVNDKIKKAKRAIFEARFGLASKLLDHISNEFEFSNTNSRTIKTKTKSEDLFNNKTNVFRDCIHAHWLIATRVLASSYHSVVADLSPLLIERDFVSDGSIISSKSCTFELIPLLKVIKFIDNNDFKSAEKEWRNNVMLEKTNSLNISALEMLQRAEEKFGSAHLKRLAISQTKPSVGSDTTSSTSTSSSTITDELQKKIHSLTTAIRMQKEARELARLSFIAYNTSNMSNSSSSDSAFFPTKSSLLARSLYSSAEALYQLGQIERSAQYFESAARESLILSSVHPLRATCLSMAALVLEEVKYATASSVCQLSNGDIYSVCLEKAAVIAAQDSLTAYAVASSSWSLVPSFVRQHNADWAVFSKRAVLVSARASPVWQQLSQLESAIFNARMINTEKSISLPSSFSSSSFSQSSSIFSFLPQLTARALGHEGDLSVGLNVLKESLSSLAAIQTMAMPLSYTRSISNGGGNFSSNSFNSSSSLSDVVFRSSSLDFLTRTFIHYDTQHFNISSPYVKMISQLATLAPAKLQTTVNINTTSFDTNSTKSLSSSIALLLYTNNLCDNERAIDIATLALVHDELIKSSGASSLSSFSTFTARSTSFPSTSSTSSPSSPHFLLELARSAAEVAGFIINPNRHGKLTNAIISATDPDAPSTVSNIPFWSFSSSSQKKQDSNKASGNSKKANSPVKNADTGKTSKTSSASIDHPIGFDRYSFDSFNEDGSGGFYSSEQSLRYAREAHAQALLEGKSKSSTGSTTSSSLLSSSLSDASLSLLHEHPSLNLAWSPRSPPSHLMNGLDAVKTDAVRRISDVFVRCYVAYFGCKSSESKGKQIVKCESQRVPNAPPAFIDLFKPPNSVLDNSLGMLTPLGLDYLDLLLYEVLASASAAREKGISQPEWDFAFQQKGSRAGLPTIVFKK